MYTVADFIETDKTRTSRTKWNRWTERERGEKKRDCRCWDRVLDWMWLTRRRDRFFIQWTCFRIRLILSGSEHNCDFCVSASWANLSSNFIVIPCDKINIVCVSCDCDVVDQTDQEPIHLNKINNGINSNKFRMIIRWHRNIVLSCGYLVLRK